MDLGKVLAELREELDVLNAAIQSLEQLQHVGPRARRRPVRPDVVDGQLPGPERKPRGKAGAEAR